MGRRRRHRWGRKKRTHVVETESPDKKIEKSFVMKRGKVGKTVQALVVDVRNVMRPHTAVNLRERKANKLKDFVHVAGPLGVTHFMIFSATEVSPYLRIARLAHGPTLTFQIKSYTLTRDVVALQQRPRSPGLEFRHPPLVVLNNFRSKAQEVKLMSVVFQKLFPALNVQTVSLADCRRVVLFHYDEETKTVNFRHYLIDTVPVGVSKSVKRLLQARLPNDLHSFDDISQYVLSGSKASESDLEEDTQEIVEGDPLGKVRVSTWNRKKGKTRPVKKGPKQSAVRLTELGPRMDLQLIKIEEDLCSGRVMFHQFVEKTPEEIEAMEKRRQQKAQLKAARRSRQEANIRKKGKLKDSKKPKGDQQAADSENDEQFDEYADADGDEDYYEAAEGDEEAEMEGEGDQRDIGGAETRAQEDEDSAEGESEDAEDDASPIGEANNVDSTQQSEPEEEAEEEEEEEEEQEEDTSRPVVGQKRKGAKPAPKAGKRKGGARAKKRKVA